MDGGSLTMNKRMFLKLGSMLQGQSFASSVFPCLGRRSRAQVEGSGAGTLTNWAGNYRYSTERVYPVRSTQQARELVRTHSKLKVLGTRHCFNGIADSTANLIAMREMDQLVALGQIVFRFALDVGMVPLTGTTDPDHMRADLEVFDVRLEPDEVERIERLASP
jgi:xylitol oxidase